MRKFTSISAVLVCAAFLVGCFGGPGGSPGGGDGLKGADAVARLQAKGYQALSPPTTLAKGNATTTTFMTAGPKTMTIMIMEYNPAFSQTVYNSMKGPDPSKCALFGDTIVTISGGTPETRAKAMQDIQQ